jgi:hypothetical protein
MTHISHAPFLYTIRIIALTLVAVAGFDVPASAGPVFKMTNEGAYAYAVGSEGCVFLYLDVGRYGTTGAQRTWLYYDLYDSCRWESIAWGSGEIPNEAFTLNKKSATLQLNVAATPTLFTQGATGDISLVFERDQAVVSNFTGHSTTSYADRTVKWHGSAVYTTAMVSGQFLVTSFARLYGGTGQGKGRELTIERSGQ